MPSIESGASARSRTRAVRAAGVGLTCIAMLASFAAQAQRPTVPLGPITPYPGPIIRLQPPNLVWNDRNSYEILDFFGNRIPSERIFVDGLGIDDDVDVIDHDPGTYPEIVFELRG